MLRPGRRTIGTVLRAALCSGIFLLLFPRDFARLEVLMSLATFLSVLAVYELAIRDISPDGLLIAVAGILSVAVIGWLCWVVFFPPPPEPTGPLIAADDPAPANTCHAGANDFVMAFGTDRVMASGSGAMTPFMAGSCQGPVLTRGPDGLHIDAFGYDWASDIAYGIRDSRLEFTEGAGLHMRRPDSSTIELLDRFDDEVLYIRYLNRHAVRLRGRFLCGEDPQIVIRDHAILLGGVRIGGAMFGQHPAAGHICGRLTPDSHYGIQLQEGVSLP